MLVGEDRVVAARVIAMVAREEGVPVYKVVGPGRWYWIVGVRRKIALLLRDGHGFSERKIGFALNRHRTTIISLLKGGKHKRERQAQK